MDLFDNCESLVINSTQEIVTEGSENKGNETLSEETYCSDQLNISGNSCDCAGYFEMPECVMDIYLLALDGGDDSNAALRQISDVYGPKDGDKGVDSNCNYNPEPGPNEGCGCSGSYNGGAGAGTAECGCSEDGNYELGFKDKKRDAACGQYEEPGYQRPGDKQHESSSSDDYQQPLANKKPESSGSYMKPERNVCNHNNVELSSSEINLTWVSTRTSDYISPPVQCSNSTPDLESHQFTWVDDLFQTSMYYDPDTKYQGHVNVALDATKTNNFIENERLAFDAVCNDHPQIAEVGKQDPPAVEDAEEDKDEEDKVKKDNLC